MFAHAAAMVLLTMERYLLMDSVVVDLDDPEQAYLPKSLEWTKALDPLLLNEFLDLMQNTPWVLQKDVPKDNMTMYSQRVKAYGDRQVYFSKSLYKASLSDVVDNLYLANRRHDGWNSDSAASKVLEYGGKNKYVLWYETHREMGGMLPPMDFVSYAVKIDCGSELASAVRKRRDLSWQATSTGRAKPNQVELASDRLEHLMTGGTDEEDDCSQKGPIVIIYTNASRSNVDHPVREGVQRGVLGTGGVYIQGLSVDPPVTFLGLLINAELNLPGFVPDILTRRFFVMRSIKSVKEFRAHLRRVQSARQSRMSSN